MSVIERWCELNRNFHENINKLTLNYMHITNTYTHEESKDDNITYTMETKYC